MKDRYIVLIVLICGTPILLGNGYGIQKFLKRRICRGNYNCPPNEECKKDNDHDFSSCYCLSNAYRNATTGQCELKYKWEEVSLGQVINVTGLVPIIHSSYDTVVGRNVMNSNHTEKTDVGILRIGNKYYVHSHDYEFGSTTEVLRIKNGAGEWKHTTPNDDIPNNAIGRRIKYNEIVYICRFQHFGTWYHGSVSPKTKQCLSGSYQNNYNYEILIHNMAMRTTPMAPTPSTTTKGKGYKWEKLTPQHVNISKLAILRNSSYYNVTIVVGRFIDDSNYTAVQEVELVRNDTGYFFNTSYLTYVNRYEVLRIEDGEFKWINTEWKNDIPDNAIKLGKRENETIYVCADELFDNKYAGSVLSETGCHTEIGQPAYFAILTYI